MIVARLWAPYWDTHNVEAILTWDAMGYYIYLPAHFIYGDLRTMAFAPKIIAEYAPTVGFYQAFQVPGAPLGHLVTKYPIGMAILEAPFFGIGHLMAKALGYPPDGFSAPYQISIAYGGVLYAVGGLAILRRVMLRYFSDFLTALTLVLVVLGTNFTQYGIYDSAMVHGVCFALYAVLLWGTLRWHETPRRRWALLIGATLGLLVIVRPSEAVALVLPLLWGIDSVAALRAKGALALRYWPHLALAAVAGLLAVSPQLFYWKWATGHWLFYSYEEQSFSFLHPHLRQVLFSYRKGWLTYTPLALLALVGFWPLWRQARPIAVAVLVYTVLNLWIVSAWDIWWYGGSFGQRAMVQSYAALSLPLAALLSRWPGSAPADGEAPPWRSLMAWPVLVMLVTLNLFQVWQYMAGIIVPDGMHSSYWRAVFLNAHPTQTELARLSVPKARPGLAVQWQLRLVGQQTFDQLTPEAGGVACAGLGGSVAWRLNSESEERAYTPDVAVSVGQLRAAPGAWLRAGGSVYCEWGAWNNKLIIDIRRGDQQLVWHGLDIQSRLIQPRSWTTVYADVALPPDLRPTDVVRVYGWAPPGSTPCYLDNLTLEVAERR